MKTKVITTIMTTLFLASMLSMAFVAPVVASGSEVVGLWHFDSICEDPVGSGTWKTLDSSGHDNHGTLIGPLAPNTNGPTLVGGKFDKALDFDGVDDYVDCGTDSSLNLGTAPFTVELWVNWRSLAGEQVLIEKYIETYDESRTGWGITKLVDNNLIFYCSDGGITEYSPPPYPPTIAINEWYYVAVTRSDDTFTLYWNGAFIASGTTLVEDQDLDTTSSLKIGHRGSPTDTPGSQDERGFYFNGIIDEVRIWDQALTAHEIRASYARAHARARPTEPPMLEGTKFDLQQLSIDEVTEWELPADEPFYVIHGWAFIWSELTNEERRMVLDDSLTGFELSVDDNLQKLRPWSYFYQYVWENEQYVGLHLLFYIQFDANEFEVGFQHIFEGRWYAWDGTEETWAVTVTFT